MSEEGGVGRRSWGGAMPVDPTVLIRSTLSSEHSSAACVVGLVGVLAE